MKVHLWRNEGLAATLTNEPSKSHRHVQLDFIRETRKKEDIATKGEQARGWTLAISTLIATKSIAPNLSNYGMLADVSTEPLIYLMREIPQPLRGQDNYCCLTEEVGKNNP